MRMGWTVLAAAIWFLGTPLRAVADELPINAPRIPSPPQTTLQLAEQSMPPTLDQLAGTYATPKAVASFLREAFTFKRDEELFGEADRWQSPEEFVARKAGDCEDYALLARAILRRNGMEAYVFTVFGNEGYAHTVCVFADHRGRYDIINVDKLRVLDAKSLESVAAWLSPAWTVGGIAEQVGAHGEMVTRLTNSHRASFHAFTDPVAGISF